MREKKKREIDANHEANVRKWNNRSKQMNVIALRRELLKNKKERGEGKKR